ncbi:MAG: hypothetical protein H0U65_17320 [Rubrobacter sp.]|nr:hypothetical protein [Rubrobacter sp.]
MKLSTILRWAGPAGIGFGVFLVFSAMSGLPIEMPFISPEPAPGFEVVSSGLVLWALVMLLIGMAGLYAREPEPGAAKVIEWDELPEEPDLDEELERLLKAEATKAP